VYVKDYILSGFLNFGYKSDENYHDVKEEVKRRLDFASTGFLNRQIEKSDPKIWITKTGSFRNDPVSRCSLLMNELHLFIAKSI